jgi:predicted esterase
MLQHSSALSVARRYYLLGAAIAAFIAQPLSAQPRAGISTQRVSGPGSLDWAYVLTGHSPADAPDDEFPNYAWQRQSYDFFRPNNSVDGENIPLIIYISPSNRSKGWHFWEASCRRHGVMYASPRKAGNSVGYDRRVRIVLDILGDIRSQYNVDPDRTYLVGFSGGAAIAEQIAFRLPEFFGGVLCTGRTIDLPTNPLLRHRTRDRLSVALVCGERDPVAPLVEFRDAHVLRGFNYRCESKIVLRLGHTMPPSSVLEQAFLWMEEGLDQRRKLAAEYPMSRSSQTLSREDWATGLLQEAEARLKSENEAYRGIALLESIISRWPELPAATQAKMLLEEQQSIEEGPWCQQRDAEIRLIACLRAEGMQRLATSPARSFVRDQQGAIALEAVARWEKLLAKTTDEEERQSIAQNIKELRNKAKQTVSRNGLRPLLATRFRLVGKVTVQEGIENLTVALGDLGYELVVNEAAYPNYAETMKESRYLQLPAATVKEAFKELLGGEGVKLTRRGNQLHVSPKSR